MCSMDNHAWAKARVNETGGSLGRDALDRLAELTPGRVLEFGAGYSTVFLAKSYGCDYIAVEHNPKYAAELRKHQSDAGYTLAEIELGVYSAAFISQLHASDSPRLLYDAEVPDRVPKPNIGISGLRLAWYDAKILDLLVERPDLVIHDGCNGDGRSIAYPLLRDAIKGKFHLFVDDLQAFDFEQRLREHFEVEEVWRIAKSKSCALFVAEAKW